MSKLQLPNVTLCLIDCLNTDRSIKVIEHCKSKVDFGAVKFLTSIPNNYEHTVKIKPLNSLIAYSVFMLTKCHEYFDTPFVQIIQRDGWILNPQSWNENWLNYDFIGPLFIQYARVGSGGFSLRSKRIMQHMASITPKWDGTDKQAHEIQRGLTYYEDGQICLTGLQEKFKFPSNEEAADYGQGGNRDEKYFREYPYGFHRTFQSIDFKTGRVDSSDLSKDLKSGYDEEIDNL